MLRVCYGCVISLDFGAKLRLIMRMTYEVKTYLEGQTLPCGYGCVTDGCYGCVMGVLRDGLTSWMYRIDLDDA